jgi:hypothetical protein
MFELQALKPSTVILGSIWGQSGVNLGSTWVQPGVNLGSTWGQPGVNLGSTWGHPGVNLGSIWGQPGVNLQRPAQAVVHLALHVPRQVLQHRGVPPQVEFESKT